MLTPFGQGDKGGNIGLRGGRVRDIVDDHAGVMADKGGSGTSNVGGEEKQRQWGVDTYSRWDKLEDDDAADAAEAADKPGGVKDAGQALSAPKVTQFNLGNDSLKPKQVNHISPALAQGKGKRVRSLPQDKNEVWQVVIRKLRVWSAASSTGGDGGETVACRPYSLMITSLYPTGKLVLQQICDPPESRPGPVKVLEWFVEAMLNPLCGSQRRPKSLTFVDKDLAEELFESVKQWGVEASQLSESEGVDEVVQKFSELLVSKDIASMGPTSEKPGLLARHGIQIRTAHSFWGAADAFARREPWALIHERKAFEFEIRKNITIAGDEQAKNGGTVCPGKFWVSVMGHDAFQHAKVSGKDGANGDGAFGLAVFFSKLDLQARLVPEDELLFLDDSRSEARCSFSGVTEQELGRELKRTKPRKMDIRTGEELMYKDADALRSHWPSVRKFAVELDQLEKGRKAHREHWLGIEATVLFEDATYLPFDDLDAAEKYGWPIPARGSIKSLGHCVYPLALQFKKGDPERPTQEQLVFLELALNAVLLMQDRGMLGRKQFAPETELQVPSKSVLDSDYVQLFTSPSSIFYVSEANAAKEAKLRTETKNTENNDDSDQKIEPDNNDQSSEENDNVSDEENTISGDPDHAEPDQTEEQVTDPENGKKADKCTLQ